MLLQSRTLPEQPAAVLATEQATRAGDAWEIYRDLPRCEQVGRRIEVVQPITFAHASV